MPDTDTEITIIVDNEEEPKYDFSTEEDILIFAEVVNDKLTVHIAEVLTPDSRHPGMASYVNDYDNMLDYYIETSTDISNFTPNAFHIVEGFSGYFTKDYYGEVDVEHDFKNIRLATYEEYAAYDGDYDNE